MAFDKLVPRSILREQAKHDLVQQVQGLHEQGDSTQKGAGKVKTWLFEGEQRPFCDICAMVPALSRQTVRMRLRDGYTTRVGMLTKVAPKVVARDGSRVQYSLRATR